MDTRTIKLEKKHRRNTSISKKWLSQGKEETEWDWEGVQKRCQMSLTLFILDLKQK